MVEEGCSDQRRLLPGGGHGLGLEQGASGYGVSRRSAQLDLESGRQGRGWASLSSFQQEKLNMGHLCGDTCMGLNTAGSLAAPGSRQGAEK